LRRPKPVIPAPDGQSGKLSTLGTPTKRGPELVPAKPERYKRGWSVSSKPVLTVCDRSAYALIGMGLALIFWRHAHRKLLPMALF